MGDTLQAPGCQPSGSGVPLVGVVYDPKVSAFLRYIGQELFMDLGDITAESLAAMLDRAVEQAAAQSGAVARLRDMERGNVETARRLLEAGDGCIRAE